MAFNLNKNDGAEKSPSAMTSGKSKFDLTKGEEPVVTPKEPASGSTGLIVGLLAVLLIGAAIWFYVSKPQSKTDQASTALNGFSPDTAQAQPATATNPTPPPVSNSDTTVSNSNSSAPDPINQETETLNRSVPATFAQGSANFSKLNRSLIKRINTYLAKNPSTSVNVNGYASSDGTLAINQAISQARADAFKQYLVGKNIAANRIEAVGKGIDNPIASNETNAGRMKNRRVEIYFLK
jgi:outer membrane protein OmpA-like peptidoglycan-associated protein